MTENLYVHFPFCRSRCAYCTLLSRAGASSAARADYVARLVREIRAAPRARLKTVYFGGGSPALCALAPFGPALAPRLDGETEFTVELHPLDATPEKLDELKAIGVNRISMGVQSLDDDVLRAMGRGYTSNEAARAFARAKRNFANAGIDLIIGYPHERADLVRGLEALKDWGLAHASAYSLQNERGLADAPDDDTTLDRLRETAAFLESIGLARYEISNYAAGEFACRHNLAVWRGEDYTGLGEGACGREGLTRTRGLRDGAYSTETVTPEADRKERALFRLRTRDGLDATPFPEWLPALERLAGEGLLVREGAVYRLTARGTEVCDAVLADLV